MTSPQCHADPFKEIKMLWSNINRQFSVFIWVGCCCAALDVGLMRLLEHKGISFIISAPLGFAAGLILNFLLHAHLTFNAVYSYHMFVKFVVVVLMNFVLMMVCVTLSHFLTGMPLFGKILSLPLVAINGFLWSKYWVYKK